MKALTAGMIEMTTLQSNHLLCVRLQGVQSSAEFGALGRTVSQTCSRRRWRILLDWTELEGWDDRRGFNVSCQNWHPAVARASIVHRHRWNHQAALLAAVFRVHGAQVLSWSLRDRGQAADWLIN
jgi:hypothetical protein